MADSYNVFDELSCKGADSQLKLRAVAEMVGQGDDAILSIPLRMRDVAQARNGTGARRAKGFGLSVRFEHNGHEFTMRGWMSITNSD